MRFALLITAAPESGPGARTALRFARAVHASGHELARVFFFADGVYQVQCSVAAAELASPATEWVELAAATGSELVACVSSALRRGVVDADEARRHGLPGASLHASVQIGGLGLLHEALRSYDRVVHFPGAGHDV